MQKYASNMADESPSNIMK